MEQWSVRKARTNGYKGDATALEVGRTLKMEDYNISWEEEKFFLKPTARQRVKAVTPCLAAE